MENLNQYYNTPDIQSAQAGAESALTSAGQYQSAAALLPTKLKEAIQEKLDYNKDIIEEKNKAMEAYFQAPSKAREQYQNIWNPFSREALVTQARTQAYTPYANLTDILKERRGTIADVVTAGTGAFTAAATAQQNAATLARQKYADLIGIADKLVENKKWVYEQTHAKPSSAAGQTLLEKMIEAAMIKEMGIDPNTGLPLGSPSDTFAPTTPAPNYSPGAEGARSSDGNWIWVNKEWIPIKKSSTTTDNSTIIPGEWE